MARTPYIEIRKGVERNQKVCRVWVWELICGRSGTRLEREEENCPMGGMPGNTDVNAAGKGGRRPGVGVRVSAVRDEQANRHNIWPGSVRFA